ncbi:hypothetical protein [Polynucleobacter sp. MG-6-Vaara-E2]|uniref:hypothetical protein n=1 Tax=Polynucleobacter sp. MG-6-Vaara-E2 TaxID=2576932 RepID=UPI001BFD686F|nr:hypothetical protein [Polynucleobacter sp. MG-6-Vaara-E2]QWD96518.1 hypothetical protein ICV38_09710 [Polynucleobacter sp. MG-6-Vaara-E2]
MFKSALKVCVFLAVFSFLVACSPKLNWRTVQSPEQRYSALFPGKPDKLDRLIPYQAQELKQTLEAVKIDDDIYSISSIQLPVNQSGMTKKMIEQLQGNLLDRAKVSGGNVLIEEGAYQASDSRRIPVKDYFITLSSNGKTKQSMRVRWIVRLDKDGGNWIYQVSILHVNAETGDAKTLLSKEEFANFFNEFRPE